MKALVLVVLGGGLVAGLVACTTGWGASSLPAQPPKADVLKGCPPASFDLAAVAKGALGVEPQPKVKKLRVLAWKQDGDAVGYIDEALVWIETESDGFVVAHVAHVESLTDWSEVSHKDESASTMTQPAAPSHDQFERFLNKSRWEWNAGIDHETFFAGEVCADEWQQAFNEAPWHKLEIPKPEAPAS